MTGQAGWHQELAQALALRLWRSLAARHLRIGSPNIARKSSRRFWFRTPPVVQGSALLVLARLFALAANAPPPVCWSAAMCVRIPSAPFGLPRRDTSNAVRSSDQRDSTSDCPVGPCPSDWLDNRPLHRLLLR